MNKVILLLTLLLFSLTASSQGISEQLVYGGNGDDQMFDILSKGEQIISVGFSTSSTIEVPANYGGKDFYFAVLDQEMNFLWARNYGGPGEDIASIIIEDSNENYVVAGTTAQAGNDVSEFYGDTDIWLVSVDQEGELLWDLSLGTVGDDRISDLALMPNGDLMVLGWVPFAEGVEGLLNRGEQDMYLARVSAEGELLWQKGFGNSLDDSGRSLVVLDNGECYIAGGVSGADFEIAEHISATDIWVAHISGEGDILNQATYGANKKDTPTDMLLLPNGDLMLVGETFSDEGVPGYRGSGDVFFLHLNSELEQISWQAYGGSSFESPYDIMLNSHGSLTLAGLTYSIDGDIGIAYQSIDGWLMDIEIDGTINWSRAFGGNQFESIHAITEDSNGQLLATGYTDSVDGDVIRAHGNHLCWTFRIDLALGIEEQFILNYDLSANIFPNPASQSVTINLPEEFSEFQLKLLNLEGQVLVETNKSKLDISLLHEGLYFIQLSSKGYQFQSRLIIN